MRGQYSFLEEIIVDNFAGGGGASTGMELATGRPVAIAINHDPDAIAMHETNHPFTEHLQASVWDVDPKEVCRGRPVGLAWFSPDCKHFSKAKGKPLVDRNIRGLSWVIVRWAMDVRPRVMMMENVEEIQTWGPLIEVEDGWVPDPEHKGETFQAFVRMLTTGVAADHPALEEACEFLRIAVDGPKAKRLIEGLGYDLEFQELIAADYGAPTTRKRFVMVARCDGKPVVFPKPTHSKNGAGGLKPWVAAHTIIDWSQPMYSIFDSKQDIKKQYGVNVVRPLKENTLRRIIRGVDKFTIKSGDPFLIPVGYGEKAGQKPRVHDINQPLPTVVGSVKHHVVKANLAPVVFTNTSGSVGVPVDQSIPTIRTCAGGGLLMSAAKVAPVVFSNTGGSVGAPADQPIPTVRSAGGQILSSAMLSPIIGQHKFQNAAQDIDEPLSTVTAVNAHEVIAANLIQYHTEQSEKVRGQGMNEPIQTVDSANRYGLVGVHMAEYYGNADAGYSVDEPIHTVTSKDRGGVVGVHVQKYFGGIVGESIKEPLPTVTSVDHNSLVGAHITEFKGQDIGQDMNRPLRTGTTSAGQFAVVGTRVEKYSPGTDLGYWAQIRALLNQYCGYDLKDDEILLLNINGVDHYLRDIYMRMLIPRELYNAMGFTPDYVIDRCKDGKPYTKTKQVARCGNAVCPPMAEAVVRANLPEWCGESYHTMAELMEDMAL